MSFSEASAYPSPTPSMTPSLLQEKIEHKRAEAFAGKPEMDVNNLSFPDYVSYIKKWMFERLSVDCFKDEQKLFEAFEALFQKEVCSMLGTDETFGEEQKSYHHHFSPEVCQEPMKSFHQAQFVRCIRRCIWLELVSDVLPAAYQAKKVQTSIAVGPQSQKHRIEEDVPVQCNVHKSIGKLNNGKLTIKLSVPKMKKGPGSAFEEFSMDRGVWCWSSRRTCSQLGAIPSLELLSPPLTWRLNQQEIHVYHVVVPVGELEDDLNQVIFDLMDVKIDIRQGALLRRHGIQMQVYYVSIECSEFNCTKRWMPQEEAACYRSMN